MSESVLASVLRVRGATAEIAAEGWPSSGRSKSACAPAAARAPVDDDAHARRGQALAAGFLHAEGIVEGADSCAALEQVEDDA